MKLIWTQTSTFLKSINLSTGQSNPLVTGIDQQLLVDVLRLFPAVVQIVPPPAENTSSTMLL